MASAKKLFDTGGHSQVASVGLLILRLMVGVQMAAHHGVHKVLDFSAKATSFWDPFAIGSQYSLGLVTFAELGCAILLVLGLGTRLAAFPLAVAMGVAAVWFHLITKGHDIAQAELPLLYMGGALALLFLGPGRFSIDQMLTKK